jgi:Flp pilus assembly protein TadG
MFRVRHRAAERGESGASAVELALVMPVLVMLVFGIVAFGQVLAQQATLSSAVRSGARYGSVNIYAGDHTCKAVMDRTRDNAISLGMNKDAVAVTVKRDNTTVCSVAANTTTGTFPDPPCKVSPAPSTPAKLTVTASYDAKPMIPLIPMPTIGLSSVGEYQCEYN